VVDLNNPLVGLIGDQDVAARQEGRLHRGVELIESGGGNSVVAVLPDDVTGPVDQDHPVVRAAGLLCAGRVAARGVPVPEIRVRLPTRCASLVPTI
jgi:hypothetical protein